MANFPQSINDGNYDFPSKQFFLIYPDGKEDLLGRQVFTTMSQLEKEKETRIHRESGSKYPWQGGSVETPTEITFTRGLGVKDGNPEVQLEQWYDGKLEGVLTGNKLDLIVEVFLDTAEDLGQAALPTHKYILEKCKPKKYAAFEGDANSSDTAMETLVVVCSRWRRDDGGEA